MSTTRAFVIAAISAWVLSALAQEASAVPILCNCCVGSMSWCAALWLCC